MLSTGTFFCSENLGKNKVSPQVTDKHDGYEYYVAA
jgi:hypothetical protein